MQQQGDNGATPVPVLPVETPGKLSQGRSFSLESDELFLSKVLDENPAKGIELLYRKYYKPLCTHAIKYVGSKDVAEDLVSEVFYDFYRTKAFSGIRSSYRFYLFRSVRNRAWEFLRSELKHSEYFSEKMESISSGDQNPEDITQFEEMYQDVQAAVNALPIERRKIYLMNRFEGKPYQQIAEELNLSVKTVEVQLYRANKFIRGVLRAKWLLFLALSIAETCWMGKIQIHQLMTINASALI
jgi:RNA polymerase sigma-70 factor (family 1)